MTRPLIQAVAALAVLLLTAGCSISQMATESFADALAADSIAYAADDDIELVGEATPFALKTMESVLGRVPEHRGLLTAAARGFTQYAYVYLQLPADELELRDVSAAYAQRERALRLYLRARDYGLRGLGVVDLAARARLLRDPVTALSASGPQDVELIYWTALAWAAAVSLGKDDPSIIAGLPVVDALVARAVALDPAFDDGGLQTFLISYATSRPAAGTEEKAREHFERAVALTDAEHAGPFVALAESVAAPAQRREEFERLLGRALSVDPDAVPRWRLANLVIQRRARWLLAQADTLFVE